MSTQRYRPLKKYKGIREDLKTGNFLVQKSLNKKRYSKTFSRLKEAIYWQKTFTPVKEEQIKKNDFTFGELWTRYREQHLANLEKSTIVNRLEIAKFFVPMFSIPLESITPKVISELILTKKNEAIMIGNSRRRGFNQELKLLKAIFNWHHDLFDYKFCNPVTRQHKILGKIAGVKKKEKKLSLEELRLFFGELKAKPFWYDFALIHLLTAGRVQEIAGLQKKNLNFETRTLLIKEVVVWDKRTKKFDYLKPEPKNGEIRQVFMNDHLSLALKRQMSRSLEKSTYVFNIDGGPLSYRQIQHNYDKALKACGLGDRFSGTHILRHSMATLTRLVTGSLEATQAVTGHKDQRLVEHYGSLDHSANIKAQLQIQNHFEEENFFNCEQV